jgi:hypothetical protein
MIIIDPTGKVCTLLYWSSNTTSLFCVGLITEQYIFLSTNNERTNYMFRPLQEGHHQVVHSSRLVCFGGGGGDEISPYKLCVGFRSLSSSILGLFFITSITVRSRFFVVPGVRCGWGWSGSRCRLLSPALVYGCLAWGYMWWGWGKILFKCGGGGLIYLVTCELMYGACRFLEFLCAGCGVGASVCPAVISLHSSCYLYSIWHCALCVSLIYILFCNKTTQKN